MLVWQVVACFVGDGGVICGYRSGVGGGGGSYCCCVWVDLSRMVEWGGLAPITKLAWSNRGSGLRGFEWLRR